jgi:hypothetical protein
MHPLSVTRANPVQGFKLKKQDMPDGMLPESVGLAN